MVAWTSSGRETLPLLSTRGRDLTWLHAFLADVSVSFPPLDVECALYAPQILQVLGFEHLAPVANHVGDKHGIITAVLRPIRVDRAVMARAAGSVRSQGQCASRAPVSR